MDGEDIGNLGFQQRNPNSGMFASSQPDKFVAATSMSSTPNSVFGPDWDPLASLSQNVDLKVSSMDSHNSIAIPYNVVGIMESQGTSNASHLMRYQSDSSLGDLPPKISSFGSGSFSAMISSFGLSEYDQMAHALREGITNKNSTKVDDHGAILQGDIPDDGGSGSGSGLSPNDKKRKRVAEHLSGISQSQYNSVQNMETEQQKELSQESTEGLKEKNEKKQKTGKNSGATSRGKQTKDNSQNGESSKEDYIHVRARRGQATNSHSLAERVRREKISQRMRFLQDLVPGCNKITGKALMLDEIINYVQSLQRQVEFLSMKLATVNPDLNIDIDRILSKEVLNSRGEGSALLGFGSGMSSSHQPNMTPHRPLQALQTTNSHVPHFPQMQGTWDDELQNVLQMNFLSNQALESLGLNAGNMKVEL